MSLGEDRTLQTQRLRPLRVEIRSVKRSLWAATFEGLARQEDRGDTVTIDIDEIQQMIDSAVNDPMIFTSLSPNG